MTDQDLIDLLSQSMKKNAEINITGMLVYMEGYFMPKLEGRFIQYLEGAEKDVKDLFQSIKKDNRNIRPIIMSCGKVASREFSNWSMSFEQFKEFKFDETGFQALNDSVFRNTELQGAQKFNNLLKSFYEINKSLITNQYWLSEKSS